MQQEAMNFTDFAAQFSTEGPCRAHMFNMKWPKGFVGPKCGHTNYCFIKRRNLYQCRSCEHQASLTAGTRLCLKSNHHIKLGKFI